MITDNEIYEALCDRNIESGSAHIDLLPQIKMMIVDNKEEFSEVLNEVACHFTERHTSTIQSAVSNMLVWENYIATSRPWSNAADTTLIGAAFAKALDNALDDYAERNAEELIERALQLKNEALREKP